MFKSFSPDFKEHLYSNLENLIKKTQGPHYAAFDADGTLWEFDLGETFFHYQIQNSRLDLPLAPLKYYLDLKAKNPQEAYLWLAQINQGKSLEQVRAWAEDCVKSYGNLPIFPDIRELIHFLQERGVVVYVVTASIKWAVEPGAKRLDIPFEQVLGVQTKIIDGIVSDVQEGEITYRHGKASGLLHLTNGVRPILCAGNTMGDYQLLEASQGLRLCLSSSAIGEDLHATEAELVEMAAKHSWLHHRFR